MAAIATEQASAPPANITVPPPDDGVADFSIDWKPIRFRFNGSDVFEAVPLLPVPVLRELGSMHASMQQLSTMEKFDKVLEMFDLLLKPESGKRFRERIESRENPVDLQRQIIPSLNYVIEKFGLRPTQPAGSSFDGSSSSGTTSTDGAPPEESTPTDLPPTGS